MTASISRGHLKLVNLLVKLDGQAWKIFDEFDAYRLIGLRLKYLSFLG
jgi:hypothetical protein